MSVRVISCHITLTTFSLIPLKETFPDQLYIQIPQASLISPQLFLYPYNEESGFKFSAADAVSDVTAVYACKGYN